MQIDLEKNQKGWLIKHLCHPHPGYVSTTALGGTRLRETEDCTSLSMTHTTLLMLLPDCRPNSVPHGMKRDSPPARNSSMANVAAEDKFGESPIAWLSE